MSRIIRNLKCEKCGNEVECYRSFCHPEEDLEFAWECNCRYTNIIKIKAMPKEEK
jgi:hypothetical protein